MKWKDKIKQWLLRKAIAYIVKQAKDSNYVKNAYREFELTWKDYKKDEMQSLMADQIIELLSLLSTHGDSGFSIGYKKGVFNKLMMFEPLGQLTFEDDEFGEPYEEGGTRQNKRNSAIFKQPDGEVTFLNGIIKKGSYYIGEDLKVVERNGGTWSGNMFVLKKDGTFDYISSSIIIRNKKAFNNKSFTIPIYEIEYPKDWWLSIVREQDLELVKNEYDLKVLDNNSIEKELNFKDGIYRKDILKRIELVRKHINKH